MGESSDVVVVPVGRHNQRYLGQIDANLVEIAQRHGIIVLLDKAVDKYPVTVTEVRHNGLSEAPAK